MRVEDWLGEDNQLGIDIFHRKYQYNNETFDEWLERVSGGDQELKQLIKDKKFLFGGRILANRGTDKDGRKISLSNCYVISPPDDSIESIFDCAKKLARTYSYGGGCGIDIGKLAPKGATIHNAAKETSGAVSFMDLYSMVTGLIGQNGRRGALMISIPCDHPDLKEFIGIKQNTDRVTKANISIRITDKFMVAVKNHQPFKLNFTRCETGETITKTVDAYELFHKICEANWDYAEPGMLFWDRIENWNLLSCDHKFKYGGVNPCFAGNMELLTTDGYKTFEELDGKEFCIYNVNGNVVKSKVWCSGEKDTVKVKVGNKEIICTPDHRFMTINGDECMAKDLKGQYLMPCTNANIDFDKQYIKLGFIQGDGQTSRLESKYHEGIEVNIGVKDTDIWDLFSDEEYDCKTGNETCRAIYLHNYQPLLKRLGFSSENLPNRVFPSTYNEWTYNQKASFLHGCYSANGCVIKNGRISYKTTCKKFAEQLLETLTNDFNIKGVYITTNKPHKVRFKNGEFECQESYDVNIGQYKEITKFISQINFYQQYKREQLSQMMRNRAPYVINVVQGEKIKVYDFTEPERHWGIVEGYVVHNCAEEPLPPGGSCLLGSINLSEFVTDNKQFNFDDFKKTVDISIKALNEVLDEGMPLHPLQEQRDSVRDWRQCGLGIFGLADMLIKMNIKYGSPESIDLCDKIGYMMAYQAIQTSSKLAEEFGTYPMYDESAVSLSAFWSKHVPETDRERIAAVGLHNSQLLTIAPTGTLSTMLGVSGGIEPIFANYYTRKTESLHGHDEYYKVYTPIVKKYMDEHNIKDDKDLPDFFVTAQNLDYKNRIDMQAIWQNHIDASISSTVNLPHDTTIEEVEDLYMYAWEKGLKGVTIFRDGCKRVGILTTDKSDETDNENPTELKKLERGMIIKVDNNTIGKERHLVTGCGTLHLSAFFDPDTGDLLESYLSKGSSGGCLCNLTAISRMISLSARAGVDVYTIADQLKSVPACPSYAVRAATRHDTSRGNSCPVAVANALIEMYEEIQDDLFDEDEEFQPTPNKVVKAHSDNDVITAQKEKNVAKCPECGGELVFEGGCNTCRDCGYSHCG